MYVTNEPCQRKPNTLNESLQPSRFYRALMTLNSLLDQIRHIKLYYIFKLLEQLKS
jgi:hypothetical protein